MTLPGLTPAGPPYEATGDITGSLHGGAHGPYRLVRRVGEGGMSVVHLALTPSGDPVAVKVLRPHLAGDEQGRARFAREVRAMRRVRGRHVAEVLDAAVDSDMPYLVTRYVPGPSLHEAVREAGPLPVPALLRLGAGLADALVDIHAAGLVHRDLKPGNVLLEGELVEDPEPVVIDFGIARLGDDARLTSTGLFVGTPGYLPPEVLEGGAAGPASDVHAWGATMAYAATGRPVYGSGPLEAVLAAVLRGRVDLEGAPALLVPLLREALDLDPARRPTPQQLQQRCATLAEGFAGERTAVLPVAPPTAGDQRPWPDAPSGHAASEAPPGRGEWRLPPPPVGATDATAVLTPFRDRAERPPWSARPDPAALAPASPPYEQSPWSVGPEPAAVVPAAPPYEQRPAGLLPPPAPPPPDPGALAARHRLVLLPLLALVTAVAVLLPVVAAAVTLTVLLALRTADSAALAVVERRWRRGYRRGDAARVLVGLPWHVVRAALATVTNLVRPVLAGAVAAAGAWLVALAAGWSPERTALAAGAAVVVWRSWAGWRGEPLRRPATWALDRALRTPLALTLTVGALTALAAFLVLVALGAQDVSWWPVGSSSPEDAVAAVGSAG